MNSLIAGVDEVGRGSLVGPVVAAAVILGSNKIEGLKDSKKLSQEKRCSLSKIIKREAISFSIGIASKDEIDNFNIRRASLLAMQRAIHGLNKNKIEIIVDGIDIPEVDLPCEAIVKADSKIFEVMAASIIAKVHRDNLMANLGKKYPKYFLEKNKGYPTKEHLNILKSLGPSKHHRKSYKPVKNAR